MADFTTDTEEQQVPQPPKKLKVSEFAAKVKVKYPEYKDLADDVLVDKIIAKYPQYKTQVDIPVKKNESQPTPSNVLDGQSPVQETPKKFKTSVAFPELDNQPQIVEETDPIALAKQADALSKETVDINTGSGTGMYGGSGVQSVSKSESVDKANEIYSNLKNLGYDGKKLAKDFDGIPDFVFNQQEMTKPELLDDYKNNPQLYERKIATAKWQTTLTSKLKELQSNPELAKDVSIAYKDAITAANNLDIDGDYASQRNFLQQITNVANKFGGDKKDDILRNLGIDISYIYGKAASDPNFIMQNAGSKLNNLQAVATNYLQDIHPEELRKYTSAFLKDEDIKDNENAQLAKEESLKRLEELGIRLNKSYLQEKLNPIKREYDALWNKSQTEEGLTPDEMDRAKYLEEVSAPYTQQLQYVNSDEQQLLEKYPKAGYYEANQFAQELLGQRHSYLNHALSKVGEAVENTGAGVYDFVAEPFRSEEASQIRQADILGEGILGRSATYVTGISGKPVLSDELKADVEKIKKNNTLSDKQKEMAVTQLVRSRNGEWYKDPESNLSLKSLVYGVTDMATALVPFIGLEMITGGGATAGIVRKVTSSFVSAAATSFEDSYRSGIEKGVKNPYAYATRVTAINSAAIAGAGTASEIRAMFSKQKTPIANLVSKMTDKEIEAALKEAPKSLRSFKSTLDGIKSKFIGGTKSIGKDALKSFGEAAKINAAMSAGNIVNDAISGELRTPIDYAKDYLLEGLKFGILGTTMRTATKMVRPTDMSMAAIYEAANNKDVMLSHLDEKIKDGSINEAEGKEIKRNVEDFSKIVKKHSEVLSILHDKQKREYLYNAIVEQRSRQMADVLPEKQAEKYNIDAEAAKYKNAYLVEPKSPEQLEKRKVQLEKSLVPEKDAEGKNIEIPKAEVVAAKAEMQAIDDVLADHKKANEAGVVIEAPTKVNEPIQIGTNAAIEKAKEGGVEVQQPMNIPDAITPKEVSLTKEEQDAVDVISKADFNTEDGKRVKIWTDIISDPNATVENKKQALKELGEQLADKNSETETGLALGKSADAIYNLNDANGVKVEPLKIEVNEETQVEVPKSTAKEGVTDEGVNKESGAAKEGEGTKAEVDTKELDKMTSSIPNGGEVKKYLSGDTIKKYEEGTELRNNQEIVAQELEPALKHGVETIEKAKEVFGEDYVPKTLEYIKKSNINPENKALLYVSLENEMAKRVLEEPDNLGLKKLQDLVRTESQAYLRSNSLAINMGRLRKFAEVGYDISKVTDQFFSPKEIEQKEVVEKLVQADADTIQKQYEEQVQNNEAPNMELEAKVKEGVEAEINRLYEAMPKSKKDLVNKAIAKLDAAQKKLRSKRYSDATGMVALVDMGITTIKTALKAGIKISDAIEIGINKIKEKLGEKWEKENEFREDMYREMGVKAKGEKTVAERLADAEARLQKQIDAVRDEIISKERAKGKSKLDSIALERLREQKKALEALRDKYLPKEKDEFEQEKKIGAVVKRLEKENLEIDGQIKKGEKDKQEDKKTVDSEKIKKLKDERDAKNEILEALDPDPKIFTENALIKKGFGKKINVKTKDGVVEREILDWKKLAGEEGSIDNISKHVGDVLKESGYTEEQGKRMADAFIKEYDALRASIIEKGLNEVANRNKTTVTANQKSAAKKLAEMYNYGLFDKNLVEYETALAKTIGVTHLNPENLKAAVEIGEITSKILSSKFQDKPLNERELRTLMQTIDDKMRYLLADELWQNGGNKMKATIMVRTYMDLVQRMGLNSTGQAVQNPFSGAQESLFTQIAYGLQNKSVLNKEARKLGKNVYKEITLQKGAGFGNVETQFINKGNLEMEIDKMSDNKYLQGLFSTMIGKTTLDAVDSAFKIKITQQKFIHNLITILTKDRVIDGKVEKGMSREDAKNYVAEKITGQSLEDAKKTAKEIIDNINKDAGKKIFNDSEQYVNRLANDIVNAALVNGGKITTEMVDASYGAAYKAAGRGLGHVANNFMSKQVGAQSGKLESEINTAIKNKDYDRARTKIEESIFYRNIVNPYVGGGMNWVVLKAEKTGLGLVSALWSMRSKGGKLDLSTTDGMKNLEKVMYENMMIRDKVVRGAAGAIITGLGLMLFNTDEYKKWRGKHTALAKYTDNLVPEANLFRMAISEGRTGKYAESFVNKNSAFDKGANTIKAVTAVFDKDKKAEAKVGGVAGSLFGAPVPWRLFRDGHNIYQDITGGKIYKVDNTKSQTWYQEALKGGMLDWLGLAPKPESSGGGRHSRPTKNTKD